MAAMVAKAAMAGMTEMAVRAATATGENVSMQQRCQCSKGIDAAKASMQKRHR